MIIKNGELVAKGNKSGGSLDVNIQDQYSIPINLYLCVETDTLTLASTLTIDDVVISVTDATSADIGQVINIFEDTRFYQSIIVDISENDLTVASPLDFEFTTEAKVTIGSWNLAVDGSLGTITAYIKPPSGLKFDIYSLRVNLISDSRMDSSLFGSLDPLSNGILFRLVDGTTTNLPLVVNNMGFAEQGFEVYYDENSKADYYGFRAKKNYNVENGVSLRLNGATQDEFRLLIRDDLTDLSVMSCTINGHVVQED